MRLLLPWFCCRLYCASTAPLRLPSPLRTNQRFCQPASFEVFTCLTCHEHRRSEMDDEHDEVRGYVYESTACYSCHPDGEDDLR